MLTGIQYRILKRISPRAPDCCSGSAYEGKSKLAVLMGDEFFTKIAGKVIIDFGCGEGAEAVEMAGRGAQRVIGIDIREDLLQAARQKALGTVSKILVSSTKELADIVVSLDAFEHFADPARILRIMNTLLRRQARCSSASGQPGITHWAVTYSPFFHGHI